MAVFFAMIPAIAEFEITSTTDTCRQMWPAPTGICWVLWVAALALMRALPHNMPRDQLSARGCKGVEAATRTRSGNESHHCCHVRGLEAAWQACPSHEPCIDHPLSRVTIRVALVSLVSSG